MALSLMLNLILDAKLNIVRQESNWEIDDKNSFYLLRVRSL